MPVLKNARHELFAQEVAKGSTIEAAYAAAGYAPSRKNAGRIKAIEGVAARILEIQRRAADRAEASVERILKEQMRLGYSNVTDVLSFTGKKVTLKSSDQLSEDVTAAISEVRQTKDGVQIKFHDKNRALEALARHKGMYRENINLNVTLSLLDLVNASYPAPEQPKVIEHKDDEAQE